MNPFDARRLEPSPRGSCWRTSGPLSRWSDGLPDSSRRIDGDHGSHGARQDDHLATLLQMALTGGCRSLEER